MASFSIMAVLGANISGFVSGMNSARSVASSAGSSIGNSLKSYLGGKLSGIASLASIEAGVVKLVEFGGKVTDLSAKLGISTDDVQAWDYALGQSGGSIEEASKAFTKLGISISKANAGDKGAIKDFTDLGIAVDTLRGKTAGPVMLEIAKKFKAGGGDDAAMEGAFIGLAGKSADSMFAAFRDGAGDKVSKFTSEKMGIDEATLSSLDEVGDKWDTLMQRIKKVSAPAIAFVVDLVSDVSDGLSKMIKLSSSVVAAFQAAAKTVTIKDTLTSPLATGIAAISAGTNAFSEGLDKAALEIEAGDAKAKRESEARKAAKFGVSPEKEAEREMTRKAASEERSLRHAREQLELEQRKGQLASMTATQRAASLREEMEALKAKADMEADPLEKAKLQTKAQKLQNDLDSDERKAEKAGEKSAKAKAPERNMVNSLQQMGTVLGKFTTAPEVVALDLQRRSEDHLQAIRKGISKIASSGGFGSQDES